LCVHSLKKAQEISSYLSLVNLTFTKWLRRIYYYNHSSRILCWIDSQTHTHMKIPIEFSETLTSNWTIFQWVKAESQGDRPRWCWQSSRYSEKCPTQRELLGIAHCGPEELKRAFFGTTVYRVSRWFILGISIFPSWSWSTWFNRQ